MPSSVDWGPSGVFCVWRVVWIWSLVSDIPVPVRVTFRTPAPQTTAYRDAAVRLLGSNRKPPKLGPCGHVFAATFPSYGNDGGKGEHEEVDSGVWEQKDTRNGARIISTEYVLRRAVQVAA